MMRDAGCRMRKENAAALHFFITHLGISHPFF